MKVEYSLLNAYGSWMNGKLSMRSVNYLWQRREHIKWGIISGDGVEWLGYESLHGPEACSYMYYGGNGWTDGCADTVDNPSLTFYLKRMAEEQNQ